MFRKVIAKKDYSMGKTRLCLVIVLTALLLSAPFAASSLQHQTTANVNGELKQSYSGTNLALPFRHATGANGLSGWGWADSVHPVINFADYNVEHTSGVPSIRIEATTAKNADCSDGDSWRELDSTHHFAIGVQSGDYVVWKVYG